MIALIEKELRIRDRELKELGLSNLSMDTMPNVSSKVNSLTTEKQILHKLLKEQKLQRRGNMFALENGLLLFAIVMFGVLGAFVFYLVSGANIQGTWDQMGSDMAVIVLLLVMTSGAMVLYFQHYKHNFSRK